MVVGLYATVREESYLLIAYMSERIIVRVSTEPEVLKQGSSTVEQMFFLLRILGGPNEITRSQTWHAGRQLGNPVLKHTKAWD